MSSARRGELRQRLRRWIMSTAAVSLAPILAISIAAPAKAADLFVTTSTDHGAGSLRQALLDANSGDHIVFASNLDGGNTILLEQALPTIRQDLTIDASLNDAAEVHGLHLFRVFFVESGNVEIDGLTITEGIAKGGDGGGTDDGISTGGTGGGGGGLGAGGAVFVDSAASLTLKNVTIQESIAEGGDGGDYDSTATLGGGAGGGGLGGNGGAGTGDDTIGGGGGGGGGVLGDGGASIFFGGGGGGGLQGTGGVGDGPEVLRDGLGDNSGGGGSFTTNGGLGTGTAGFGGDGVFDGAGGGGGGGVLGSNGGEGFSGDGGDGGNGGYGGGGGGTGANSFSGTAGDGGTFGGGGGAGQGAFLAGNGGFGGGGGGASSGGLGGTGGFGGGGGGSDFGEVGGDYGGDSDATGGGGGAALGGAIFVNSGGTLILNNTTITDSQIQAGVGAGTAAAGEAAGKSIFLHGSDLEVAAEADETTTISDSINDSFDATGVASSLTKSGEGTVVINGDQGYHGATFINEGNLVINGSVIGDVAVYTGTLGGNGVVGGDLYNFDRIAAGNSIGTLTTAGDLSSPGTIEVEVAPGGTTAGVHNDLYNVTGQADLSGGTIDVVSTAGEYDDGAQYTFLTAAGGIVGAPTITDQLFFFDATLDSLSVPGSLIVQINDNGNSFTAVSHNQLQLAIAEHLEYVNSSPTGEFLDVMNALLAGGPSNTRQGLSEIAGQIYPTMASAQLQQTSYNLSMLRQQLATNPPCETGDALTGWVRSFALDGSADASDYGASGFDMLTTGTEIAFRKCIADNATLGCFVNLASSDIDLKDVNQSAEVDTRMFGGSLQLFGSKFYGLAIGGVGLQDYKVSREFTFIADRQATNSDFNGTQAFAYLEQGMQLRTDRGLLQPYVALQGIHLHHERFLEEGPDTFSLDLQGNGINADSIRSILGISFDGPLGSVGGPWFAHLQAAWMHEYLDSSQTFSSNSYLQDLLNDETTQVAINGSDLGSDWAVLGAGLRWQFNGQLSVLANYQNQISSVQSFHTGSGGVQVQW